MRLTIDHHYPTALATTLRESGFDVITAAERGWHIEPDDRLLELSALEGRAVLTNNVADFMVLARVWQAQGRTHCGLLFTSDRSWPRTRANIGPMSKALSDLLNRYPNQTAWVDRVFWL